MKSFSSNCYNQKTILSCLVLYNWEIVKELNAGIEAKWSYKNDETLGIFTAKSEIYFPYSPVRASHQRRRPLMLIMDILLQ